MYVTREAVDVRVVHLAPSFATCMFQIYFLKTPTRIFWNVIPQSKERIVFFLLKSYDS